MIKISPPLKDSDILALKVGDEVLISGIIYTARDRTHQRIVEVLKAKKSPPFSLKGQIIFYAGPTPSSPGRVIGSIGPTSSYRMDKFTSSLLVQGLKGMIGKGPRSSQVKKAIQENRAVYFCAIGGAAAWLSKYVKKAEIIAYEDLGPEAVYKLQVENFPVLVAVDCYGEDIFEQGRLKYKKVTI